MDRRSKLWLAFASLCNLINAGGGGYAAALGEGRHAALHAVLLIAGSIWAWRLATRAGRQGSLSLAAGAHLEQLQQSVDAIAVEVERISEAQRFSVKLQQQRGETDR